MKAQISRGKGQKGLLAYVFEGHRNGAIEKGARLVGGTCSGTTLEEIQAEFSALRKIRPDVEKPAWHCSLSLKPPESLTDKQWAAVTKKFMRGMGFSDQTLYAVVRHADTEHDHIHIVASRIGLDGKIYLGQREAARSMPLTNQIAREFGLSELAYAARAEVKGITAGEKGLMDRTSEIPTRIMLQTYIHDAAQGKPSFSEFVAKLEAQGVAVIPSGKTGQAQGMTFELDGVPFTGTKLGDKYKWKPLQARLDYNPERDQPVLDRLRTRAEKEADEVAGELKPAEVGEPVSHKNQRTLELAFEQTDDGIYRWKGRDTVAIVDRGESISVRSKADSAVRASLQLAKDKGWSPIVATGDEAFKRKSWLIGSEMGLTIQGYEPTQADHDELNQRLQYKEARYGKNSGNTEVSRAQPGRNQDRSRAVRDDREYCGELQSDSRRPGNEDRSGAEGNGRARQQNRLAIEVQASGSAGTNNSRGPDLAHDSSFIGDRRDIRSVTDAAGALSDLAAPIAEARSDKSASELGKQNAIRSREHKAKIAAWERQSEALGAEKYRITLKPRAEKDSRDRKLFAQNYGNPGNRADRDASGIPEKFWTKEEITQEITKLRAKNTMGYDVYITSIDNSKHFIVVDDMTPDKEKALLDAGIKPAIIQKSRENNKQAIIIIDKESSADEQKLANQIVTRLNKKWGDPKFSGVCHPFRLAGFNNKKQGKNNFITTLELSIHRKCNVTSVAMRKLRIEADRLKTEAVIKRETDKEFNKRVLKIDDLGRIGDGAVELAYRRELRKTVGLVKKKGWTLDWSRVDFAATKELLKAGYRADLIAKAIIEASPELSDRHSDAAKYAADTLNNARADAEVIKALSERAQRVDRDQSHDR